MDWTFANVFEDVEDFIVMYVTHNRLDVFDSLAWTVLSLTNVLGALGWYYGDPEPFVVMAGIDNIVRGQSRREPT